MNNKFDELAKGLAQSVTRRQALKRFGVGLAGMVLACFGLANKAQAWPKTSGFCVAQYVPDAKGWQLTGYCQINFAGGCLEGFAPHCSTGELVDHVKLNCNGFYVAPKNECSIGV